MAVCQEKACEKLLGDEMVRFRQGTSTWARTLRANVAYAPLTWGSDHDSGDPQIGRATDRAAHRRFFRPKDFFGLHSKNPAHDGGPRGTPWIARVAPKKSPAGRGAARYRLAGVARVLFAHGHLLRRDAKQFAIGKPYPPLATLFAAAHARARGHHVALFDPMLERDTSGFFQSLDREKPDIVVLYDDAFNWFTKMCLSPMREAACAMIGEARARGLPVVVAGHDAADEPEHYAIFRAGCFGLT